MISLLQPELAEVIKRSSMALINSGGIIRSMENVGCRKLPHKMFRHGKRFDDGKWVNLSVFKMYELFLKHFITKMLLLNVMCSWSSGQVSDSYCGFDSHPFHCKLIACCELWPTQPPTHPLKQSKDKITGQWCLCTHAYSICPISIALGDYGTSILMPMVLWPWPR